MPTYDYIIAGGGAAGLSLLHAILQSSLRHKSILLVDKDAKDKNDRTWCFWEDRPGPFQHIVCKEWSHLWIHQGSDFSRCLDIAPFTYKMIQGIDFYRYMDELIGHSPNVDRIQARVDSIQNHSDGVALRLNGEEYRAAYCFSSIPTAPIDKKHSNYLDQHFRGWFIKTDQKVFNVHEATLMDFRVPQHNDTRFLYVLPTSESKALVEIAIFSNQHLTAEGYDSLIKSYLDRYWPQLGTYQIERYEAGNIPMTDYAFPRQDGHIIYIGMAGGDTRGSSGYTFYNIQRRVRAIVQALENKQAITAHTGVLSERHQFYDSVLLRVLAQNTYPGDQLFRQLFATGKAGPILRFLNGESSLGDELKVILSAPKFPFTRAAIANLSGN